MQLQNFFIFSFIQGGQRPASKITFHSLNAIYLKITQTDFDCLDSFTAQFRCVKILRILCFVQLTKFLFCPASRNLCFVQLHDMFFCPASRNFCFVQLKKFLFSPASRNFSLCLASRNVCFVQLHNIFVMSSFMKFFF
jgi:hypothetical protein